MLDLNRIIDLLQTFLNAANAVIGQNSNRLGKKLWTKGNEGDKIEVFEAYNEQEEANFISENAHSIFSAGDHYKDMAVLYRSNAQSRTVEEALVTTKHTVCHIWRS